MTGLEFTWMSALKLFAGALLFGVCIMTRQQAKKEREAKSNGETHTAHVVPKANIFMAVIAILFLLIALFWGNEATI